MLNVATANQTQKAEHRVREKPRVLRMAVNLLLWKAAECIPSMQWARLCEAWGAKGRDEGAGTTTRGATYEICPPAPWQPLAAGCRGTPQEALHVPLEYKRHVPGMVAFAKYVR